MILPLQPFQHFRILKALAFASTLGLLAAGTAPLRAQTESGGVESPFELGLSARALGLGGAVGAMPDVAGAALDNPAILSAIQRQEVDTFHASLFVDTTYDAIAYSYPDGRGAWMGAFFRLATSDIPLTTNSVQSLGSFSVQQIQGVLAYGLPIWKGLGMGAAVKYLRQSVPPDSDSGFAGDLGLLWRPEAHGSDRSRFNWRNLTAGFSVSNLLQPEVRLRTDLSRNARILKGSLAYRIASPGDAAAFSLGLEGQSADGVFTPSLGGEFAWRRMLFLRGGYDGTGPCFGAGFQYRGAQLDWAMAERDLGDSQRFSLSYRFGSVRDSRSAQRLSALKWIARTFTDMKQYPEALRAWEKVGEEFPDDPDLESGRRDILKKRDQEVAQSLADAKALLAQNQTLKAIPLLTHVLALDPENPGAKELFKRADESVFLAQDYLIGLEAFNRSDYRAALEAFDPVYRRAPQYRDVARLWSEAKGRYEPLANMPEELSQLYGKGVSEFLKGRYRQAIEIWQKVLAKQPTNFIVQRNIAEAQARLKDGRAPDADQVTP